MACKITCLRSASVSDLQKAVNDMPDASTPAATTLINHLGAGPEWGPLVDGTLITQNPGAVGVKVPSIFGSNTKDGSVFILGQYRSLTINESVYDDFLRDNFASLASTVNSTYNAAKFNDSGFGVYAAMEEVLTDVAYRCPAYRGLLGAARNKIPAWTYSFGHTPTCSTLTQNPVQLNLLGATHGAEIPFVFNLTFNSPPPLVNCTFTSAEKAISLAMAGSWTSMAENGNPGSAAFWPAWAADSNQGMNIVDAMTVGTVDYSSCTQFWNGIEDSILKQTTNATTTISPTTSSTTSPTSSKTPNEGVVHDRGLLGLGLAVGVASILIL
jgi:para-nitrobenzyl esterase